MYFETNPLVRQERGRQAAVMKVSTQTSSTAPCHSDPNSNKFPLSGQGRYFSVFVSLTFTCLVAATLTVTLTLTLTLTLTASSLV